MMWFLYYSEVEIVLDDLKQFIEIRVAAQKNNKKLKVKKAAYECLQNYNSFINPVLLKFQGGIPPRSEVVRC